MFRHMVEAYMVMMEKMWRCDGADGARQCGSQRAGIARIPKRLECEKKYNAGMRDGSTSLWGCAGDGGSSGLLRVSR